MFVCGVALLLSPPHLLAVFRLKGVKSYFLIYEQALSPLLC